MEYVAPATLDDACRALEMDGAYCLAGGQSLVAMMNLGLATPERLVSLRRIAALRGIETARDGALRIGAMTTHAELAALSDRTAAAFLLAQTARVVAYPAIRNRGTIGGSVALADPAADYPVALVAADATIEIVSAHGARTIPARDFFHGMFETSLASGEIVAAVRLPAPRGSAGSAYAKLSVVAGDFAIVSVAAVVTVDENAPVTARARDEDIQVAVGGYAMKPILLSGLGGVDDPVAAAAQQLASHGDPPGDHRASSAYRRRVTPRLIERALAAARASTARQALRTEGRG
jgi:aerobic carbon-monoxide dehydrogenase medium subunit